MTHSPLSWKLFKRVLTRWRWYACSLLVSVQGRPPYPLLIFQFAISGETESFGSNNLMGQWLEAIGGYSVEQTDYYPAGVTAFGICSTLVCATWTDRTQVRWPVLVYMAFAGVVASICILVWSSPTGLKFFAYCEAWIIFRRQNTDAKTDHRSCRSFLLGPSHNFCVRPGDVHPTFALTMLLDGLTKYVPMTTKKEQSSWYVTSGSPMINQRLILNRSYQASMKYAYPCFLSPACIR